MSTMKEHAAAVLAEQERQARLATSSAHPSGDASDPNPELAAAAEAALSELGIRVQSAVTAQHMLPHPTYAAEQTIGKARGFHQPIGRIMGTVTGTELKRNMVGGELRDSIALLGTFQARSDIRGEVIQAAILFLPMAFSAQIAEGLTEAKLEDPAATVTIDVDLGFESTGKNPVCYAWTVTHYLLGKPSRALRDLMAPRRLTQASRLSLARLPTGPVPEPVAEAAAD